MEKQMVVFELGNEFYGVDIAAVEGIIKMQAITKMPQAPAFVDGITNLRGSVVPVIDLRTRFGLPRQESSKETRIITIVMDGTKIGMVVDGVSEVLSVPDDSIEPPPPDGNHRQLRFYQRYCQIGRQAGDHPRSWEGFNDRRKSVPGLKHGFLIFNLLILVERLDLLFQSEKAEVISNKWLKPSQSATKKAALPKQPPAFRWGRAWRNWVTAR
jgi:purine-binding chemotaxis protein CheW